MTIVKQVPAPQASTPDIDQVDAAWDDAAPSATPAPAKVAPVIAKPAPAPVIAKPAPAPVIAKPAPAPAPVIAKPAPETAKKANGAVPAAPVSKRSAAATRKEKDRARAEESRARKKARALAIADKQKKKQKTKKKQRSGEASDPDLSLHAGRANDAADDDSDALEPSAMDAPAKRRSASLGRDWRKMALIVGIILVIAGSAVAYLNSH